MKLYNTLLVSILLIGSDNCFSQTTDLEIITKQNDTIRNIAFKKKNMDNPALNYKLQDKIEYVNAKMEAVTLLPSDVKSFSFKYNNTPLTYESMEDKIFALVMYSNKVRLLRFIYRAYTPVDIYAVQRPDNGTISYLEAKGLSRRISLKVISRELKDCPATIKKVEDDILKIHGEPGVLELIKDYETSCY